MKKVLIAISLLLTQITFAQSFDDQVTKASEVLQKKEYCNALSLFQTAFKDSASIGVYEYAAGASAAANCKQEKLALLWLKKSQQMGLGLNPGEIEYLESDSSFIKLYSFKEWNEIISSMKKILVDKKEKADKWLTTVTLNCISKKQNEKYTIPKPGFALYYITVDSFKVPYLVYIPKTYNVAKPIQAIVYLHGGVASLNDYMLDELVTTSEPIFAAGDQFNSIIIYPFGKRDFGWMYQKKAFENILTIIKNTQQVYNIDDKRIFLGGMSNGGTATFWFASQKPNMFKGFYAFSMNPKLEIGEIDFKNISQGKPFYSLNAKDDELFNYIDVQKVYLSEKDIAKDWHFETVETGTHSFIYNGESGKKAMDDLLRKVLAK